MVSGARINTETALWSRRRRGPFWEDVGANLCVLSSLPDGFHKTNRF